MKKVTTLLLALLLIFTITACSQQTDPATPSASENSVAPVTSTTPETPDEASNSDTRTITDMAGNEVTIPSVIKRYADSWFAHNEIDVMLGADDRIVATSMNAEKYPWLYLVGPGLTNALSTFGTDFNLEELVQKDPQVVFSYTTDKNAEKIASMGIPVVQFSFKNFDEMMACVALTGEILGGDAVDKAAAYNAYLSEKVESITSLTDQIAAADRPSVLHVVSLNPIKVDGSNTIIDDWINVAGGINAAAELESNMQEVTIEQIIAWNPDIIIVGGSAGTPEDVLNDANWASIAAVKNGAVYQNPSGAFLWDRYGAEEALQVQWAAKTIQPDLFKDFDIAAETKNVYKTFLNYDLSDEQVQKILLAQRP